MRDSCAIVPWSPSHGCDLRNGKKSNHMNTKYKLQSNDKAYYHIDCLNANNLMLRKRVDQTPQQQHQLENEYGMHSSSNQLYFLLQKPTVTTQTHCALQMKCS